MSGKPKKTALDFYYSNVEVEKHENRIFHHYGFEGCWTLEILLKKLYKNGYFLSLNYDDIIDICITSNVNEEMIKKVIDIAFSFKVFDEILYKKYDILTSKDIQKFYLAAVKRRREVFLIKEYLLVDARTILKSISSKLTVITIDDVYENFIMELDYESKEDDSTFDELYDILKEEDDVDFE